MSMHHAFILLSPSWGQPGPQIFLDSICTGTAETSTQFGSAVVGDPIPTAVGQLATEEDTDFFKFLF